MVYSILSASILTVVSKKLTSLLLTSEVNLIFSCKWLRYLMNLSNSSLPCGQIMNISSINQSQSMGFKFQLTRALVSNLSINRFA